MKKYICAIITIIWIGIIFSFSLQTADQSSQLSGGIGTFILEYIFSEINLWFELEWELFHTLVRKCAHFTEFFVLGILMISTVNQTKFQRKHMLALCLCILVASMDETIQLFVPGRAGMITDVMLDSFGSASGLLICGFLGKMWRKKVRKYYRTLFHQRID